MKPLRLYIKNFLCHNLSFIDFTKFKSALIIGNLSNNDLYSNGVGKTTIFRAIEYVLFNQADVNLEKIIRDEMDYCNITFDFIEDNQEYRISRTRTRKGASDLSLFKRNSNVGLDNEVYHIVSDYTQPIIIDKDNKYWNDISGRRAADTEKELVKIIKINFKSFCSTVHFAQNDFTGLATSTPTERKSILKEALNLIVYSKLEKISKEKTTLFLKEIEKHKNTLDILGLPENSITELNLKLSELNLILDNKSIELNKFSQTLTEETEVYNNLVNSLSFTENNLSSLTRTHACMLKEISKLEEEIKNYSLKNSSVISSAKELISKNKEIKNNINKLSSLDFSKIEKLTQDLLLIKEQISSFNIEIRNLLERLKELKIPVPDNNYCKHCRQLLTEEHKINCKNKVKIDIKESEDQVFSLKEKIKLLEISLNNNQNELNVLQSSLNELNSNKEQEKLFLLKIEEKRSVSNEFLLIINKYKEELKIKNEELLSLENNLRNSSVDKLTDLKEKINLQKNNISSINNNISSINKEINLYNNNIAVIKSDVDRKKADLIKKEKITLELNKLNEDYSTYLLVSQAFSSTGIPNLIIQNILDDLQLESNNLLSQLKPGLQLLFSIQKTKGDGSQDETLDISYFVNGKPRDYNLLSGAMKLAVNFSLKLGLSFLLQKIIGSNIKFLLLDEIDQSLDKASIDAFSEIIKFFQNEFTILVITHNDRLKEKFSNIIQVEQDINMVSAAYVLEIL
jgi:exonuclease SbcC